MDAFLESTVVQDGHASPVIQTLVRNMYKTGILKAGCAVFRYEGFDESTAGEVEGTKIRNVLLQKSECEPPRFVHRCIQSHVQ